MSCKLNTIAMVFALWLSFVSLLVSAGPIPIFLSSSTGIELFKDVVARESLVIDVVKRDDTLTQELVEGSEPNPDPGEADVDVEARLCRYGCL